MLSWKNNLYCFVLEKMLVLPIIRHYTVPSFLFIRNQLYCLFADLSMSITVCFAGLDHEISTRVP